MLLSPLFGIEFICRQMRVVSNLRNPAIKFFWLGLSLVLANLWAQLRWRLFRRVKRDPRTVMAEAFRLKRFIATLHHTIERF